MTERKNRHIMSVVRCLLYGMEVPKYFWNFAVLTATYLINRTPSRVLNGKAPLHILQPDCTLFHVLPRVFGCTCFVQNRSPLRTKLDDKAIRCVFLGYSPMSKGYRCYDPASRRFYNSMDVNFLENVSFFAGTHTTPALVPQDTSFVPDELPRPVPIFDSPSPEVSLPPVITSSPEFRYSRRPQAHAPFPNASSDTGPASPTPLRRSIRVSRPVNRYGYSCSTHHLISQYISYSALSGSYQAFLGNVDSVLIPRSVFETLQISHWVTAMQAEMDALQHNQTWELVSLPPGAKPVGCKWVYAVKYLPDGSIDRYKARLVAKGFTQIPGKDFTATFAPVAKLTTVRLVVSLAASYSWPLHQLDVKNAFLNGDLLETIYMDPPPGFRAEGEYSGKVCRLRKSLYGLKQSPRAWFSRFSDVVLSIGFTRCHSDHTCFIRRCPDGRCIILSVYVDDIIITGNDTTGIARVKEKLGTVFDVKDLGPLRYFLGIEIARSRHGISMTQKEIYLGPP